MFLSLIDFLINIKIKYDLGTKIKKLYYNYD